MIYSELLKKTAQNLRKEKKELVEPQIYMGLESSINKHAETLYELVIQSDLSYCWVKKSDDGRYLFALYDQEEKEDLLRYCQKLVDTAVNEAIKLPVDKEYINNIIVAKNHGDLLFRNVSPDWLETEKMRKQDPLLWVFSRDKYLTNLMLENNPVAVELSCVAELVFPSATSAEMKEINQVLISAYQSVEDIVREEEIIKPFSLSETISVFSSILELRCDGMEEIKYDGMEEIECDDMEEIECFSVIKDLKELDVSSIISHGTLIPIVDKLKNELPKSVDFCKFAFPELYSPVNENTWPILCEGVGDIGIPSLIDLCLQSYKEKEVPTTEKCLKSLAAHLFLLASGIKAKSIQTCIEQAAIKIAKAEKVSVSLVQDVLGEFTASLDDVLNKNKGFEVLI